VCITGTCCRVSIVGYLFWFGIILTIPDLITITIGLGYTKHETDSCIYNIFCDYAYSGFSTVIYMYYFTPHVYSTCIFYMYIPHVYSTCIFYMYILHVYSTYIFHMYILHVYSTCIFYMYILHVY